VSRTSPTKRGAGVSADAPDAKRQALSPVVGPASAPEGDAEMGEVKMDRPAFVAKPVKEFKAGLELRAQRDERVASHRVRVPAAMLDEIDDPDQDADDADDDDQVCGCGCGCGCGCDGDDDGDADSDGTVL